jgi:serine/threonine protein kinase
MTWDQIVNALGKGSFGKVKLCRDTKDSQLYAIKILDKMVLRRKRQVMEIPYMFSRLLFWQGARAMCSMATPICIMAMHTCLHNCAQKIAPQKSPQVLTRYLSCQLQQLQFFPPYFHARVQARERCMNPRIWNTLGFAIAWNGSDKVTKGTILKLIKHSWSALFYDFFSCLHAHIFTPDLLGHTYDTTSDDMLAHMQAL